MRATQQRPAGHELETVTPQMDYGMKMSQSVLLYYTGCFT